MKTGFFSSLKNNFWALILFILIWAAGSLFLPAYIVPSPLKIFADLSHVHEGELYADLGATLLRVLISLVTALIIGTFIGLSGFLSKKESVLDAFLVLLQTLPALILGLILLFLFGQGQIVPVLLPFLLLLPMMSINTMSSLKKQKPGFEDLIRSFGGSRKQAVRDLYLPSLVPVLRSNLLAGSGFALKVVLIAEFIAGNNGIGYQLNTARLNMRMDTVFLCLLCLLLAMLVFNMIISLVFSIGLKQYFHPET